MSGICGSFSFKDHSGEEGLVRRMNAALVHRGPDTEGFLFDGPVGLGSRRSSIIDLEGGRMPIFNEDRSIAVIFDGEIYAYIELRRELERRGHRFATRSDTETIVHAYEEYGTDCVLHFRGVFAFALWDSRNRHLFLARDRLGEKPLFYARLSDRLIFASELKALLQDPSCSRDIDREALQQYLAALYVPYPRSLFRQVAKLPPGHWMQVSAAGVRLVQYWFPEDVAPRPRYADEAADELRPLLADAVRLQMRSDVPIGAMLGGGLDTASVVAYAAQSASPLQTFGVQFEGSAWDDRPAARSVAEKFGTQHFDLIVTGNDVQRMLPRLVWLMDEPNGDGGAVALHALAQFATDRVKVLLTGCGADELFAGHPRHELGVLSGLEQLVQRLPVRLRRAAAAGGRLFSADLGQRMDLALASVDRRYHDSTTWAGAADDQAFDPDNDASFANLISRYYRQPRTGDPINRLLYVDLNTYLSDNMLPTFDRALSGVGLEGRMPFLDHRLVEWALSLPGDLKRRRGLAKFPLQLAMQNLLPDDIIQRDRGAHPPLGLWLRAGLLEFTRTLLLSPRARARGLYPPEVIRRLLASDIGEHRVAQQIWMLLVLELWFRIFIDPSSVASPPPRLQDLL